MSIKKKRKWTVFFLVKSVDDSADELLSMLNELRSLRFTKHVAVVFCLNVAEQNVKGLLSGNIDDFPPSGTPMTFTTIFLALKKSRAEEPFPYELVMIDEMRDFDLTEPAHLTGFFKTHITDKFQAKRYLLFTWDHGNAYGIFSKTPDAGKQLSKGMRDTGADALEITERANKIFVRPEKNNLLTMEELATSIRLGFAKGRIDVAAMMNCDMQIVDTGFALRNNVRYLVAPEMSMDYNGYNYPFIFQVLIDDPGISPKKLARYIVSSFATKIFPAEDLGDSFKGITALSAVELKYYFNLERFVNRLSDFLSGLLPASRQIIAAARQAAMLNEAKQLIDVYTFLLELAKQEQFKTNTLLASLVFSMKELVLFETFIGAEFSAGGGSKCRPTGLSAYFPGKVFPEGPTQPSLQKTQFFRQTRWKNFLIHFQHTQALPGV